MGGGGSEMWSGQEGDGQKGGRTGMGLTMRLICIRRISCDFTFYAYYEAPRPPSTRERLERLRGQRWSKACEESQIRDGVFPLRRRPEQCEVPRLGVPLAQRAGPL